MKISHDMKEEVVNNDLELIHTAKVITEDGTEYYFKSISYITDKDIKRKIKAMENSIKFEGSFD